MLMPETPNMLHTCFTTFYDGFDHYFEFTLPHIVCLHISLTQLLTNLICINYSDGLFFLPQTSKLKFYDMLPIADESFNVNANRYPPTKSRRNSLLIAFLNFKCRRYQL